MQVLAPENGIDMWLDPSFRDYAALKDIIRTYPSEEMEMFKVLNTVNSPKFDSDKNSLPTEE